MGNLGIKPLGRLSEPSKKVAEEIAAHKVYVQKVIALMPINSNAKARAYREVMMEHSSVMVEFFKANKTLHSL